ncbi:MAG: hypothetical protein GX446_05660 [Chthonomonadales bacterium]|nr:hypothetical protein [Chthonomonadales bacterium]
MQRQRTIVSLAMAVCAAGLSTGAGAQSLRRVEQRLPLTFEQNTGRYDSRVQFVTRTGGATVFITGNEAVMVLPVGARGQRPEARGKVQQTAGAATVPSTFWRGEGQGEGRRSLSALSPQPSAVLRMKLVAANGKALASGLEKQQGIVNYFIGNDPKKWRTNVPTYARAKLAGVYPGIDVVYYSREPRAKSQEARGKGQEARGATNIPSPRLRGEGQDEGRRSLSALSSQLSALEYDFILHPGADASRIRLALEGAEKVRVAGGDLILTTPAGDVRMRRPYAYQTIGGKRVQVACDYRLLSPLASRPSPDVALRLAKYDASRPLVVDPVLEFSTYLGGTDDDGSKGVAVDASGAVYVTGHTYGADFPTTAGAFDTSANGDLDAFVLKLDPSGSALVYGTYMGGSDWDHCHTIAVDGSGHAVIAGETVSGNFPTTPGAYQPAQNGLDGDAFVAKLSPDGSSLVFGTYLGGTAWDCIYAVAVDTPGNVWLGGYTQSADWPTTLGAFSTSFAGGSSDAVVAKLSADGSTLVCSTFLGGASDDYVMAIAVDASGAPAVTGLTSSTGFPTSSGAYATAYAGGPSDAFAVKLASDATALVFSTFIGGSDADAGYGVAIGAAGMLYVGGETRSSNFPATAGAFQTSLQGGGDGFIVRLASNGASLSYSTLLGGSSWDSITGLALNAGDRAAVTGYTFSTDFPLTPDAFDAALTSGDLDAFVTVMAPDGTTLAFSSLLGGDGSDTGLAIAASGASIAVAGNTWSDGFPTTAGAFDPSANGNGEGFAVRLTVESRTPTTQYTVDRIGTITEYVYLRQYDLKRTSDNALLEGKAITFRIDGTSVGTAVTNAGGDSSLLWTVVNGPATRTITTEFAGDALYEPSSATATLTAQTHATKTFGVNRDGRITAYRVFKAWLYRLDNTPVVGKTVTFKLDGTFIASDVTRSTGLAQVGYTIADGAGAGTRTILAEWAGDGGYLPSSGANTLTVYKAIPYIWVMPRTVPQGGVARLYAYFRRLADYQKQVGKTVTFRLDGTWIADVVTLGGSDAGIARYNYTTVEPPGDHTLRCEFGGDAWVDAGYGEAIVRIY